MIRPARPEEAPAIATLFRRSFGTLSFLPTLHTPDEDRRHFQEVLTKAEVWVAEEDDRLLGFAAVAGDTLELIYVEPEEQRRGVGSALLEHVKQLRPDGFRLWVFQRNEGARRFYERHGFRLVELTDGSRNEEREPDALYEWRP